MMLFARLVLLATAFAVATFAVGWWAVPLVAAGYAAITSAQRGSAVLSGFAAMLGWGALLAITASRGPVGTLATELGGVLRLAPVLVYAVTLAFPGLLAISAAVIARSLATALGSARD
ncbi:MAG: hypothetical protein ACHQQR_09110 [Gemmatimonadales bacterium]